MRRWLHKWGYTLGVLACISTILFAALYTRQDELRALGAQSVSQSSDQTLHDAQKPLWTPPAAGEITRHFTLAQRDAQTFLWRAAPYTTYRLQAGDGIYAMCDGRVLNATDGSIVFQGAQGYMIAYLGDFRVQARTGDDVIMGQSIARAATDGEFCVTVTQGRDYIDPESLPSP